MSFKSIFRAVGRHFAGWPMFYRPNMPEAPQPPLQRLLGRSDWAQPPQPIVTDGEGVDPNRPPLPGTVRNAPGKGFSQGPDPWPAHDDPYVKPEPCDIVQDPGLLRVQKLTERGLIVPFATKSDLSNVMDLIDRQEDAEKHLRNIGMVWERGRGWYLP